MIDIDKLTKPELAELSERIAKKLAERKIIPLPPADGLDYQYNVAQKEVQWKANAGNLWGLAEELTPVVNCFHELDYSDKQFALKILTYLSKL